jgi:hypothetical protein
MINSVANLKRRPTQLDQSVLNTLYSHDSFQYAKHMEKGIAVRSRG